MLFDVFGDCLPLVRPRSRCADWLVVARPVVVAFAVVVVVAVAAAVVVVAVAVVEEMRWLIALIGWRPTEPRGAPPGGPPARPIIARARLAFQYRPARPPLSGTDLFLPFFSFFLCLHSWFYVPVYRVFLLGFCCFHEKQNRPPRPTAPRSVWTSRPAKR